MQHQSRQRRTTDGRGLACGYSTQLSLRRSAAIRANAAFSTILIRPHMPSWPTLQNSWQGIRRSPGASKRAPRLETYPGTSIRLMLVPSIRKPCTTSALVARNVTDVSVGTTMQDGVKEYC